jgi:hypothetical protein
MLLLGATACSPDTVSATTTGATTTSATTTSESDSTTVSDTSDSSQDTSTSTDTDDTTNSTTTSSISFYAGPEPDYDWSSECDPFAQDCAEGDKCVAYSSTGGIWDANKCVPILGDGLPGEPCMYGGTVEATDDCGPDSYCFNVMDVEGQAIGVCASFCSNTADEPICAPDTGCYIAHEGSVNLCLSTCNPVVQDCGPGLGCFWGDANFHCLVTTQDSPLGEPCGFHNDCAAGLGCLTAEVLPSCDGASCCASFCSVMEGAACSQMGTECSAFFEEGMAPPGYEDVGVCIVPGA